MNIIRYYGVIVLINAILFDLDGTLLNTLSDLTSAMNYAKNGFGYKPNTLEDTRRYIGNGIANFIRKSTNFDEEHFDEISKRFKEYYLKNCDNNTTPYDGIYEVLDYLKSKNIKLGVISNKAIYATEILINNHFPNYFDIIIGDGMGIAKKPKPDTILYACEKLNARVCDIIYIGDSDVDIETINNSGCGGLIVSYGFRDKKDLLNKIDRVYDTPMELLNELKEIL